MSFNIALDFNKFISLFSSAFVFSLFCYYLSSCCFLQFRFITSFISQGFSFLVWMSNYGRFAFHSLLGSKRKKIPIHYYYSHISPLYNVFSNFVAAYSLPYSGLISFLFFHISMKILDVIFRRKTRFVWITLHS